MHVAIIAPGLGYEAGAVPARARRVGDFLVRRGHRVTGIGMSMKAGPVTNAFPTENVDPLVLPRPLASLSCWLSFEVAVGRRIRALDRAMPVDLVVSHWQTFGLASRAVRAATSAAWISFVHRTIYDIIASGNAGPNWIMNAVIKSGSKADFERSDLVIALHEEMAAEIRQHVPTSGRIVTVPNGVDRVARDFDSLWAAKRKGLVASVGRLEPEKRIGDLVRAFASARTGPMELHIAGDGPQRGELEGLATDLGVGDSVRFLGAVPHEQALNLVRSSQIVALPSASEGMPFALLEGMAAGCAIVCSNIAGHRAVVDGSIARIVELGDVAGLSGALVDLSRDDAKLRRSAAVAHERSRDFDWERILDGEVAHYEAAVAARRRRR